MEQNNPFSAPLYAAFVSPNYAHKLMCMGLNPALPFKWVIKEHSIILESREFDHDDYYQAARELLRELNPPDCELPAFTVCDVMKCLPAEFIHTLEDGVHEVGLNKIFNLSSERAPRMPDAFAMLLISALKAHVVTLRNANKKFEIVS